jgi:cytochrome P450
MFDTASFKAAPLRSLRYEPIPTLPFSSPFRFLRALRTDALDFLTKWADLGGVARFQSPLGTALLVTDPTAVQHVLEENHHNYVKEVRSARVFRIGLGNGLFLSEGETWQAQRRTVQPAFHRARLADMTDTMVEAIETMLARWATFADQNEDFTLSDEAARLALDVVGRALLGEDLRDKLDALTQSLSTIFRYFSHAIRRLAVAPRFVPTPRNRALQRALRTTHRIVDQLVTLGAAVKDRDSPLLSLLLAVYESDQRDLHDIVTTFLGAAVETTAVALSWTWYLLARHPEVERRLRQEANSVLAGRRARFEDLAELAYTRTVIDEAMRLYPPAWVISRTALADDEVCGFRIAAGSSVYASPWVTHRSARYWKDPEVFDPERFSSATKADLHPYAYYPFGGGPRGCIGHRFSIAEQTLAVATVVQKFRVMITAEVTPEALFTVHPRGGIRATVSRT